ncbi:hypothetical protein [Aeromicrobium endophyticum]|uniref:Uncharacterized protein n=1 Tax=Aeromicrobium endophyticum TaxID=2292704 RepID=A0A371P4Y0_9ACTN|nr:hypothetical protein [Aeromicrobium endophyticum]REK70496.1 hypothetical protein DX116_15310 [Aeromicrobium endophyticum]
MKHRTKDAPSKPYLALVAVLGIVGLFGSVFVVRWTAGELTPAFLRAAGRLEPDAFYTGRSQDPLVGIWAYWAVALAYTAPALLVACFSPLWSPPNGLVARWANYAALGFTILYSCGVMSFAFDPSRAGLHRPLIRRYEEFSYEAADLVMAATWTMLVTVGVVMTVAAPLGRAARIVLAALTFVGSGCLFAAAFT